MSRTSLLMAAILVGTAALVGWLLLRGDAGGVSASATRPRPTPARPGSGVRPGPLASAGATSAKKKKPKDGSKTAGPLVGVEEPDDDASRPWPKTAAEFLDRLRELSPGHENEGDEEKLARLMEGFYQLLAADPEQRRQALALFQGETKKNLLEAMAHVFGRIDNDPQLQAAMIQMARSDPSPDRRRQALVAVGYYDVKEAVPVVLDILRTETKGAWHRRALEALPDTPPADLPAGDRETVVGELGRMTQSADVSVREMAFRSLGDWGDERQTPRLVEGLRDADMTVRAAAAYALALRADRSPDSKEALLRLLQDSAEDRQVRGTAADALGDWAVKDPALRQAVAAFQAWESANPAPPFQDPNVQDPTPENAPAEDDQG